MLQYYIKLAEEEKNRKLLDLLDTLEFNQVVIFVKSVQRAKKLNELLVECKFPSIAIYSGLKQEERIERYKQFKDFRKRIMVATDLFGRGKYTTKSKSARVTLHFRVFVYGNDRALLYDRY